jgi:hypothetical protein
MFHCLNFDLRNQSSTHYAYKRELMQLLGHGLTLRLAAKEILDVLFFREALRFVVHASEF